MVDELNVIGGERHHRSLNICRQRVLDRFFPQVQESLAATAADADVLVLMVETKRVISNFQELVDVLTARGIPSLIVKWETMTFEDQLAILQRSAVHVSGVGTGQVIVTTLRTSMT